MAATGIIRDVIVRHRALDDVLDGPQMPDDRRERALARMIAATTLRRHGQIEAALERLVERPLAGRARAIREILTTGLAQILFLNVPAHAAVDLAVRQAAASRETRAYKGLVNGVLRGAARKGAEILVGIDPITANFPDWLLQRWIDNYGAERARAFAASLLTDPALDISVKSDPDGWVERLGGICLPSGTVRIADAGPVPLLDGYDSGDWWVQDAAASLPVQLLGNVGDKSVLDLCAAPGGKTAQLAAAGARVTAVDRSRNRMQRLDRNMQRLGLTVDMVVADASSWMPETAPDAILLDAPCSATGTIRRNPDLVHLKTPADIEKLAAVQARLLKHAADMLPPGATLVYCTCSLEPEEGELQVMRLLANDPGLARFPVSATEVPGFEAAVTPSGELRILPDLPPNADPVLAGATGFYVSRIVRRPT